MTDTDDDLRAARAWLEQIVQFHGTSDAARLAAVTILRHLDQPVLMKPEDVPDEVCAAMFWAGSSVATPDMPVIARGRHVYETMYAHMTAPPARKKVECWAVINEASGFRATFDSREEAERVAAVSYHRVVKLVEADDADA